VVADSVNGTVAVIGAAAAGSARHEIEEQIRARMQPFAIAYRVQWME
jgi:hypothetical protein